jgi:hypothetical protein
VYYHKTLADLAYHGLDYLSTVEMIRRAYSNLQPPGSSGYYIELPGSLLKKLVLDIQIKV